MQRGAVCSPLQPCLLPATVSPAKEGPIRSRAYKTRYRHDALMPSPPPAHTMGPIICGLRTPAGTAGLPSLNLLDGTCATLYLRRVRLVRKAVSKVAPLLSTNMYPTRSGSATKPRTLFSTYVGGMGGWHYPNGWDYLGTDNGGVQIVANGARLKRVKASMHPIAAIIRRRPAGRLSIRTCTPQHY